MARPKGSKNAVRTKKANIDYAAIVAEKTAAKEQIETEIAALSDNISVLKEQLKSKIQLLVFCIIAIALLVLIFFTIRAYQVRKALKTAESETRKATLMIEKANETKNHFLSNMSYNIRIPLNGVVGFSQLIASEPNMDESTRQEYSAIIQKNSEELIQLVT